MAFFFGQSKANEYPTYVSYTVSTGTVTGTEVSAAPSNSQMGNVKTLYLMDIYAFNGSAALGEVKIMSGGSTEKFGAFLAASGGGVALANLDIAMAESASMVLVTDITGKQKIFIRYAVKG